MTDSEKLDLLVTKVTSLDGRVTSLDEKFSSLDEKVTRLDDKVANLEKDVTDIKSDIRHLHRIDTLILDEVERVHSILDKHKADKSVHTA